MDALCLELDQIKVRYLDRVVLDIQNIKVHQFDRIGVVGKNGGGKSTLLKVMRGEKLPDQGQVHRHAEVGYFTQTEISEEESIDGELLSRLAVPKHTIQELSGGEQTKLKLAQLFSTYYEGLLIDEPTTHLDAAGIDFLIEELRYYYGALVLVSHDRHVLDQLVTKIWEVDGGRVTEYTGNYSDYLGQKALQREQQQAQHEQYVKDKQRLMQAAEKKMNKAEKITQASQQMSKKETKAKANRMFMTKSKDTSQKAMQKAAKAIEKRVDQLDAVDAPEDNRPIHFHVSPALRLHNKFPIMANELTLVKGEKMLLQGARFQFPVGKVIAIEGQNGSGKTTLLEHILEDGEGIELSPKVAFGHYAQLAYQFPKKETVQTYMKERSDEEEGKIRAVLHAMDITGNDLKKNVQDLSGGERIRLLLCQLFLGRYNILVLDEPTNFLDVACIEALEQFLAAYEGTVLLVSHDRTFIERVADVVYRIEDQQVRQASFDEISQEKT